LFIAHEGLVVAVSHVPQAVGWHLHEVEAVPITGSNDAAEHHRLLSKHSCSQSAERHCGHNCATTFCFVIVLLNCLLKRVFKLQQSLEVLPLVYLDAVRSCRHIIEKSLQPVEVLRVRSLGKLFISKFCVHYFGRWCLQRILFILLLFLMNFFRFFCVPLLQKRMIHFAFAIVAFSLSDRRTHFSLRVYFFCWLRKFWVRLSESQWFWRRLIRVKRSLENKQIVSHFFLAFR